MTASMLDEIEVPEKKPRIWICSCCLFSFGDVNKYADHLIAMRAKIDADLTKAGRKP